MLHKSDPLIQVYEKVSLAMKRALEKTRYNSLETGGRLRNFNLYFSKVQLALKTLLYTCNINTFG